MAKRILTPEQKEARKERARKRRAAKKGIPYVPAPKTDPAVASQVTSATTEDDLIAPKKERKARKERKPRVKKAAEAVMPEASKVTLFSSLDSVKNHQFHRFADNDDFKSVYYMTKVRTGSNLMRGLFCKIDRDGRIDPSEYKKLEAATREDGFIGFVKDNR